MKKYCLVFILIMFIFLFSGCKSNSYSEVILDESSEIITDSVTVESTNNVEYKETIADSNDVAIEEIVSSNSHFLHKNYVYNSNETFILDLNNDESDDVIQYFLENNMDEELKAHLIINNVDFYDKVKLKNPLGSNFFILDFIPDDDFYEIIVSSEGKDDVKSQWFRYDGKNLISLGIVDKAPNNGIYFSKDGYFSIYVRTNMFETNFIPMKYTIIDNEIELVEEDLYSFSLSRHNELKTKTYLKVFKERDIDSEYYVINKGALIDSTLTDLNEWVNIIYNGNEYWLHIVNNYLIENDNIFVTDAIDNLILSK